MMGQTLGPDEHGPLTSAGLARADGKPGLLCEVHMGMVARLPDGYKTEAPPSPEQCGGRSPTVLQGGGQERKTETKL